MSYLRLHRTRQMLIYGVVPLPTLVVDLEADFHAMTLAQLAAMGVTVTPADAGSLRNVCDIFWNTKRRILAIRPRRVHLAHEFQQPTDPIAMNGLAALLAKFAAGEDVNPHLSRCAKAPDSARTEHDNFHDRLLNDWNIHHFHLGSVPSPGQLAARTSLLLFATVTPDDVYAIDVLSHGNWSRQELLERIHVNWPFLLKRYKEPQSDKVAGYTRPTDQEVATMRNKGGNMLFHAQDGTEYFPPGGGQVSAGISLDVVMWTNRSVGVISHWNQLLKERADEVAELIRETGRPVPEPITLKLEIDANSLYAVEPTVNVRILLGPMFPKP